MDRILSSYYPEGSHCYGGVYYPSTLYNNTVREHFSQFKYRQTDVFIVGYPKTGTTMLSQSIYLLRNWKTLKELPKEEISIRVPLIERDSRIKVLHELSDPRTVHSHLYCEYFPDPWKGNKIVYISRNPKDTAVSYYNFHRAVPELGSYRGSFAEFLEIFMNGQTLYGSWFQNVKGWLDFGSTDKKILFLQYEDIVRDRVKEVSRLNEFLETDLSSREIAEIANVTSFQAMKADPASNMQLSSIIDYSISPFLRKGEIGDWRNFFTEEQNRRFDEIYDRLMKGYDIGFTYM